jgi:hypothetical protein
MILDPQWEFVYLCAKPKWYVRPSRD